MKMMWLSALIFPGAGVPPPGLPPPGLLPGLVPGLVLPGLVLPGLGGGLAELPLFIPPHEDIASAKQTTSTARITETERARCNTRVFPFNSVVGSSSSRQGCWFRDEDLSSQRLQQQQTLAGRCASVTAFREEVLGVWT